MVPGRSSTTWRRSGGCPFIIVSKAPEPDNSLLIHFISTSKQTCIPSEVNVNTEVFLVCGSRCPTDQFSQIVAVGYEIQCLKVISAKIIDSSEYGKERRLVTHITGILVNHDDARVSGDAGRCGIGPDIRRSYDVFRKNSQLEPDSRSDQSAQRQNIPGTAMVGVVVFNHEYDAMACTSVILRASEALTEAGVNTLSC